MAGLLEYLIANLGARAQAVPGVTMPMPDDSAAALDPAAEAELARAAAAARGRRRDPSFNARFAPAEAQPFMPVPFAGDPAAEAEAARVSAASRVGARRDPVTAAPVGAVESSPLPSGAPMAGILGSLGMPGMQPGGGFKSPYDEANPAAVAQEARDAAAARITGRRRDAFTGLNNGAVPFAGMLSGSGLQNPMQNPTTGESSVAEAVPLPTPRPSTADLPPSTNDPMASEPQVFADGVPVPRPKPVSPATVPAPLSMAPAADGAPPDGATLPPNAAPAGPAVPAAVGNPPPSAGLPAPGVSGAPGAAPGDGGLFGGMNGILGKIFDSNRAATMLALGSGLSGAPSFGTGMRRAFAAAAPAVAADRANMLKQQGISETYKALVARGVPAQEALAAVYNPDIMKATAAKYFETKPRVPHKIGTDMMGNDIMGSFDPNKGTFFDAAGNQIGGGGGGANIPDSGAGMLAKGVTEINQELPADEYKAQFSPQVQAQMEAYDNGDTMPTGNPRIKGSATKVKEWTTLWGAKRGVPVSDATFSAKRTMNNQVASSAPNSMGGILSNGKSAFGHLATLAENFVDLGNRSGPDVPGGSWVGRAANKVGNEILPRPETSGKLEAVRDNAGKYGAEATKFYAGTGGGVEERLSALHGIASPGTLASEQAAYLKTEKGLMLERLDQKEAQIRDVMGDKWLEKHPIRTPNLQHSIDRIDQSIKRLETGTGPSPQSVAPSLQPGGSTVINGMTIKRLN